MGHLKSAVYLKNQIEYYKRNYDAVNSEIGKIEEMLFRYREEEQGYKEKLDELEALLQLINDDFKQYGWNPAG